MSTRTVALRCDMHQNHISDRGVSSVRVDKDLTSYWHLDRDKLLGIIRYRQLFGSGLLGLIGAARRKKTG